MIKSLPRHRLNNRYIHQMEARDPYEYYPALLEIGRYSRSRDILALCSTNKLFFSLCRSPNFWHDLILRDSGFDIIGATFKDWDLILSLDKYQPRRHIVTHDDLVIVDKELISNYWNRDGERNEMAKAIVRLLYDKIYPPEFHQSVQATYDEAYYHAQRVIRELKVTAVQSHQYSQNVVFLLRDDTKWISSYHTVEGAVLEYISHYEKEKNIPEGTFILHLIVATITSRSWNGYEDIYDSVRYNFCPVG